MVDLVESFYEDSIDKFIENLTSNKGSVQGKFESYLDKFYFRFTNEGKDRLSYNEIKSYLCKLVAVMVVQKNDIHNNSLVIQDSQGWCKQQKEVFKKMQKESLGNDLVATKIYEKLFDSMITLVDQAKDATGEAFSKNLMTNHKKDLFAHINIDPAEHVQDRQIENNIFSLNPSAGKAFNMCKDSPSKSLCHTSAYKIIAQRRKAFSGVGGRSEF